MDSDRPLTFAEILAAKEALSANAMPPFVPGHYVIVGPAVREAALRPELDLAECKRLVSAQGMSAWVGINEIRRVAQLPGECPHPMLWKDDAPSPNSGSQAGRS